MVLFSELVLIKLEYRLIDRKSDVNIYVEYSKPATIQRLVRLLRSKKVPMNDMEVNRIADGEDKFHYSAILTVRVSQQTMEKEIIHGFESLDDVLAVEEL